jgi:hypothetical protein
MQINWPAAAVLAFVLGEIAGCIALLCLILN